MIRALVTRPALSPDSVCAVRLLATYDNYGVYPFARFFEDGQGRYASLMDGVGVFCADSLTEEWCVFWSMQPSLTALITDAAVGDTLAAHLNRRAHRVDAMRCTALPTDSTAEPVHPKTVYPLLKTVFEEAIPPFDTWYTDVSHRTRHAGFRAVGVMQEDACVSCAMTVAECEGGALIGAVATAPEARRQGFAARLVNGLANTLLCEQKQVFICPKHEAARRLYERIGFVVCGGVITIQ